LHPLGGVFNGNVVGMALLANGDLAAGGDFTAVGTVAANRVARWDGNTWSALGSGTDPPVTALAPLANGGLVVGGLAATFDVRVQKWSNGVWMQVGPSLLPGSNVSGYTNAIRLPNCRTETSSRAATSTRPTPRATSDF